MKVALIHDHLAQDGGAEKVLKVLAEMFPEAVIYALLADKVKLKNILKDVKLILLSFKDCRVECVITNGICH